MILQSLVKLYDSLQAKGEVPLYGWSMAKVTDRLILDEDGEIVGFVSARHEEKRGKKDVEVPAMLRVPFQYKVTSGIKANFLCGGPGYFLGINVKGEGSRDRDKRARDCFAAARQLHLDVLNGIDSPPALAVKHFFEKWQPEQARENAIVALHWEDILNAGNLVFELAGQDVQDDKAVAEAWEKYYAGEEQSGAVRGICLVTGKGNQPIELLHPGIKGVRDAQSSGATLVSFNSPSFESYGCNAAQGLNAPVSKSAAFRYGAALNYLTQDKKYSQLLADTTVVYWTAGAEREYQDVFAAALGEEEEGITDKTLHNILTNVAQGRPTDIGGIEILPEEPFYILGLAPNAGRLSVRFFLCNSFGDVLKHISAHHQRMEIVQPWQEEARTIPLWRLLKRTVNAKSKHNAASPLLAGEIYRSILLGQNYPLAAYQNMLMRIFAEQDEYDENGRRTNAKIDYVRAAFIKACLLKNYGKRWEEKITMSVNENCRELPYVLGRLFAVLEYIQQNANPGIKATIKDRYFNAACATPASTFPTLLKLANAHMKKLGQEKKGLQVERSKELCKMLDMVPMPDQGRPIPKRLSQEEQGAFVLGYYQQAQSYFVKKKGEAEND